jgi:hypothetical protein
LCITIASEEYNFLRQKKSTNLLDVVVGECSAILELLSGENQSLLVWRDSLLVLDLGLHIVDRVRGLDLQSDGLSREGLDETSCLMLVFRSESFDNTGSFRNLTSALKYMLANYYKMHAGV